jgi:dipeptidyl aminopeptidase/acylaminoacyl peptidase
MKLAWLLCIGSITAYALLLSPAADAQQYRHVQYNATCYADQYENYDDLIDSWVERNRSNPNLNRAAFERQLSREDFTSMRESIDCRFMVYRYQNYSVGAFLLKPYDRDLTNLPVVIYNRPGQGPNGRVSFRQLVTELKPLVEAGFVVAGSQYPGGGGVPSCFNNGTDEFGGEDLQAIAPLFDILDDDEQADGQRIGVYGKGRGGMMALLLAMQDYPIQAAASISGIVNFADWIDERAVNRTRISQYVSPLDANNIEQRNVSARIDELPAQLPVLLLHGAQDRQVSVEQSRGFAQQLAATDHPHELVVFERGDHDLRRERAQVHQQLIDWFTEHL